MKEIEKLHIRPFTRFCMSIGAVPSSYLAGLTIEEQLLWLCSYLEKEVIPAVNGNAEAVEELQELFTELQTYVNNYFDNLDVQEEINDKLDAMAEDGTLAEIIADYATIPQLTTRVSTLEETTIPALDTRVDTLEDDVGDLDNLTTLSNNNIVDSINTNNHANQVYLSNGIVYDIPEETGHVQGSCINGDTLYVAVQGDGTYGYIYIFNITTNTFVSRLSNVLMYHGNDMTYLNGKLYIASVDNLKICVYDLNSATSSEINPFSEVTSQYSEMVGVEKIDNEHILCWLKNSTTGNNTIVDDKFAKLNINSLEYTDYIIEDEYNILNVNGNVTRQNLCIDENNNLYILMQVPQIIYKASLTSTTINFNKIYNLPDKSSSFNPISEFEALATINNSHYPTGSLMLTCRSYETTKDTNTQWGLQTIVNYIVSPNAGISSFAISNSSLYAQRGTNNFGYTSVSKSVGNLIEGGSSAYPYKSLMRGINAVTHGKYAPTNLQIIDSSQYHLPYIYGIEKLQIDIQTNCNVTIYIGDIENSNITFMTRGNATLTIKPINSNKRISFINSNICFYSDTSQAITFNECQIEATKGSFLKTRRCKFLNTESVSSTKAININDSSVGLLQFDNFTVGGSDKKIGFGGSAFVVTNVESTSIIHSGAGAMITMTNS